MKRNALLIVVLISFSLSIAYSQNKFIGNIHQYYNDTNFTEFWNQVTPENAGKWVKCEPIRDQYDWEGIDEAYEFAKEKGLVFKQHTFVWGSQYPSWMDNLSQEDQRAEVEEWIKDFGERYPDCDFIDVVNEPLPGHNPAPFKEALGGDGETGWDWVVTSFEWARQYCPNSKLILNDFGIIDNPSAANQIANIANILKDRDLIDGIGLQCHAFSMNGVGVNTMNQVLDILAATGLPIYVAELDMGGDEKTQLNRYKEKFPVLYNHSSVEGITLWGYRKDNMWITDAWLYDEKNDYERDALQWLQSFILENESATIIPGRVEAESYFRHSGVDTTFVNDSTIWVKNIDHKDWVSYVIDVLGEEECDVDIKISNAIINSSILIWVDDVILDTIEVTKIVDTISTSLLLEEGKQTFKLQFINSEVDEGLMELDWIDIYGETTYFIINASSTEHGEILPNGKVYVADGDSATFTFDANAGYKPDSVLINGIAYEPSPNGYTFYNVTEGHTINSTFSPCSSTELRPYFRINDGAFENSSDVSAIELDTVVLKTEYDVAGTTYWLDIDGQQRLETEFRIDQIQMSQAGVYGFYHSDSMGCKSTIDFDVSVNYIELDVYQAEEYESQSGIQKENTEDIGGGQNIGYIENNDWCTYEISIDEAGVYEFIARAATATGGGRIEVSQDNEVLASVNVSGSLSGGWQKWYTTEPIELDIKQGGNQTIKLTFKGGGGYLYNLNWFDLTYNRPLSSDHNEISQEVKVYPNPCNDLLTVESTFEIDQIQVFDLSGRMVYSEIVNNHSVLLSTKILNGIYMMKVLGSSNNMLQRIIIE